MMLKIVPFLSSSFRQPYDLEFGEKNYEDIAVRNGQVPGTTDNTRGKPKMQIKKAMGILTLFLVFFLWTLMYLG